MTDLSTKRYWVFDMDGTLTVAVHDFDAIRDALGLPQGRPILEQLAELPADEAQRLRDRLVPVKKWPPARVAAYGETFYEPGDRKIALNFALAEGAPLEEAPADKDVVDARLDDGVHRQGEGPAEGPAPVLRYREGDAAPDVGVGEDREPQFIHLYWARG